MLLATPRTSRHHFQGIAGFLREHGHIVSSETLQHTDRVRVLDRQLRQHDWLIHAESNNANVGDLVLRARADGLACALVMDGVAEFANTFLNPRVGADFLRPAPADIVFALGEHDRCILEALGNHAIATGLPRIDAFRREYDQIQDHEPHGLLVASANQAWFEDDSRDRLLASLEAIHHESKLRGLPVRWRVSEEIARQLRVERDIQPLAESLASASAVLTSASTLAIEAMLIGKATAIIHPHPWPLWIPTPAIYRGPGVCDRGTYRVPTEMKRANDAAMRSISAMLGTGGTLDTNRLSAVIDAILSEHSQADTQQQRIIRHTVTPDSTRRIAECLFEQPKQQATSPIAMTVQDPGGVQWYLEAVRTLRAAGASRIALITNAVPTHELELIAQHDADEILGFVVPGTADDELFLGRPAFGHAQLRDRARPDALIVTSPDGITHVLAGTLWSCPTDPDRVRCPLDPDLPTIINESLNLARACLQHGQVRTTLPPGICDGLRSCPASSVLGDTPPAMILLQGSEEDFTIYARSRHFRTLGTIVRSLRWHEQELASPERYREIIHALPDSEFAIYGAGLHTQRLLTYAQTERRPACIIDDRAKPHQRLGGIPVVTREDSLVAKIRIIILSSRQHEDRLWSHSQRFRDAGIETIPLYREASQLRDRLC